MARSKASSKAAERALQQAIAEETAKDKAALAAANAEIARLNGVLLAIGKQASSAVKPQAAKQVGQVVMHPKPIVDVDVTIPEGPAAPLAGEDELGQGRWI